MLALHTTPTPAPNRIHPTTHPNTQIRGVPVGSVLSVKPSLERVDVLTEINSATTVIPRNSLIEANQLGLIAEPQVDITPQEPVPDYTVCLLGKRGVQDVGGCTQYVWGVAQPHHVGAGCGERWGCHSLMKGTWSCRVGDVQRMYRGCAQQHVHMQPHYHNTLQATPLDEACEVEGKVVCHMGRIRGEEGVSMDKLVHTMQKMTKQMESTKTMDRVTEMMEDVAITLDDAKPLLSQAVELVDQVKPLLDELKSTNLVSNVEVLTRVAAEAAEDIHRLQRLVLDDTNVNALKDAVVCCVDVDWVGLYVPTMYYCVWLPPPTQMTLTRTLDHIQAITGDIGGVTGDSKVQSNLKQLIEALSRLVAD